MVKLSRILITLIFTLGMALFAGLGLSRAEPPTPAPQLSAAVRAKIEPRLLHSITAKNTRTAVIIEMKTQPVLPRFSANTDTLTRRSAIRQTLQATAAASQAGVRAELNAAQAAGHAADIRPLWIVNAVAASVASDTLFSLAQRDDVARIRPDETISIPPFAAAETTRAPGTLEWGVQKIGADTVWQSLGITGAGVVVANIDTGVDFLHPELKTRYRGYINDTVPPQNSGNWFDATGEGATYPVDANGHGTHTMGTMVGQDGIGVAPGARWIAVRAFNGSGQAAESWLHTAFQWVLAPDGNPALAPDVVNNSWSNGDGSTDAFVTDIANLNAAGIIAVFSAGNSGSEAGTVGAPGSYPDALAVGATDTDDLIAYFSSRGPSPWNGIIKPDVTAPGVEVVSTLPGGTFGAYNGTSMAAPHVAGTIALMKEANPALVFTDARRILTETTMTLGTPIPNNTYGWGRIDALRAVELALNAGTVVGQVTNAATAAPIGFGTMTFTPRHTGLTATTAIASDGTFRRGVLAGDYDITAAAFGFESQTHTGITVVTGTVITENFALTPLPIGNISGQVTELGTETPLTATIAVENTPVTATAHGNFSLALPAGSYTLTVTAWGHRVGHAAAVSVSTGGNTIRNFALPTAPTILLVDSGAWYNAGEIDFYRQTLDTLDYPYHVRHIIDTTADVPVSSTLSAYDAVLWSAPFDSPGFVGADGALTDYLTGGGNLLLSGQDVAYFDGGGSAFFYAPYLHDLLKADFLRETDPVTVSAVTGGIFDGLTFSISGGDGADNQHTPDVLAVPDADFAAPVLAYPDGGNAGQIAGHCLPYRAVMLPFGVEGIATAADRNAVISRTLAYFQSPRQAVGLEVVPAVETRVGNFGETVTHTMRLFNTAETGITDTFTLSLGPHQWETHLLSDTVSLAPCQTAWVSFTVTVPADAARDARDTVTLTVQSTGFPTLTTNITRTTKSPAPILLVDDDRWYDFEGAFTQSLTANGYQFDVWHVQGQPEEAQGTPPLSILQHYPQIIWFTGYDWFDPLTQAEEETLKTYLDGGGRLAFSGQEYLWNLPDHRADNFARDYFGIDSHSDYLTSTEISAVAGNPIGDGLGTYPLDFPPGYQNWTDSITPTAHADASFMGSRGYPIAVTNFGTVTGTWHTAFFAFGPELVAEPDRTDLLRHTVGWLSPLGQSTITADKIAAAEGDTITYTAVLKNDGLQPITTVFTGTFPPPLNFVPGSATGGAMEFAGQVLWQGEISPGQAVTLTYRAQVDTGVPYGTPARQIGWLTLPEYRLTFDRGATVDINTADWAHSTLTAQNTRAAISDTITYTLRLENSGIAAAPMVTVTGEIPAYLRPLATDGGSFSGQHLEWHTPVARNSAVSLIFQTQVISVPYPFTLPLTLFADDGYAVNRWTTEVWIEPYQSYLPLIFK